MQELRIFGIIGLLKSWSAISQFLMKSVSNTELFCFLSLVLLYFYSFEWKKFYSILLLGQHEEACKGAFGLMTGVVSSGALGDPLYSLLLPAIKGSVFRFLSVTMGSCQRPVKIDCSFSFQAASRHVFVLIVGVFSKFEIYAELGVVYKVKFKLFDCLAAGGTLLVSICYFQFGILAIFGILALLNEIDLCDSTSCR